MEQPSITFILNGNTYSLCASDAESIRKIPSDVRQQLISLLEAIKREDKLAQAAVQQALNKAKNPNQFEAKSVRTKSTLDSASPKPDRLGSGDVDALMARLIMEEKQNQKPGLSKGTLYKWLGGFVVVVFLLILIF